MSRTRMLESLGWMVCVAPLVGGCGGSLGPNSPVDHPTEVLPEMRITKTDPADLDRIFQQAIEALVREDYALAAAEFDRVVGVLPNGPLAPESRLNAGIAYLSLGRLEEGEARLLDALLRGGNTQTGKIALVRLARLYAHAETWDKLEKTAVSQLARTDLSVLERIEAMGSQGLALSALGRDEEAFRVIVQARNEIEDRHLGESGLPPVELAQVSYVLGELRRKKSEAISFVPFPPNFGDLLEERCQGLLDAQGAYTDAMRSLDSHWSGMAGFRVGQLYQNLHRDVMRVPTPEAAKTTRAKQLWEGAMRLRYRVLLEKGLKMMEHTVKLGERTGENSPFIARARQAQKDLELSLSLEKEALAKMPYTEDEMRAALEDLKKKAPKP